KVKALIFQAREALLRSREARDSSCEEVREMLATVRGKIMARSTTRAHIDRCPSCAAFEDQVHRQRAALALILPVAMVGELKHWVLGSSVTGGGGIAAAGMSAAGGGGAALAGGATGAGSGAIAGSAAVGTGIAGAGAAGGLAGAGATAGGIGIVAA